MYAFEGDIGGWSWGLSTDVGSVGWLDLRRAATGGRAMTGETSPAAMLRTWFLAGGLKAGIFLADPKNGFPTTGFGIRLLIGGGKAGSD